MSDSDHSTPVEYREVPGFPGYRVSSTGKIQSRRARAKWGDFTSEWRDLQPALNAGGYPIISTSIDGRPVILRVHRMVLLAFRGPCPDGCVACHNNGIPSDNRLENLRWDTPASNSADARRHGTLRRGERCTMAKLTADAVRTIRQRAAAGEKRMPLAREYGVGYRTVRDIVAGKTWAHVV